MLNEQIKPSPLLSNSTVWGREGTVVPHGIFLYRNLLLVSVLRPTLEYGSECEHVLTAESFFGIYSAEKVTWLLLKNVVNGVSATAAT